MPLTPETRAIARGRPRMVPNVVPIIGTDWAEATTTFPNFSTDTTDPDFELTEAVVRRRISELVAEETLSDFVEYFSESRQELTHPPGEFEGKTVKDLLEAQYVVSSFKAVELCIKLIVTAAKVYEERGYHEQAEIQRHPLKALKELRDQFLPTNNERERTTD